MSFYEGLWFKCHRTHTAVLNISWFPSFIPFKLRTTPRNRTLQSLSAFIIIYQLISLLYIALCKSSLMNPLHPFVIPYPNNHLRRDLLSDIYLQIFSNKILGIHHLHPCYMSSPSHHPLLDHPNDITNALLIKLFISSPADPHILRYCGESLAFHDVGCTTVQSGPLEDRGSRLLPSTVKQLHVYVTTKHCISPACLRDIGTQKTLNLSSYSERLSFILSTF